MTDLSSREEVALPWPPAEVATSSFPGFRHMPSTDLYRAHQKTLGPWWFSSNLSGRFDVPAPSGTCYLAYSPGCALRESLGRRLAMNTVGLSREELADRVVSKLRTQGSVLLANTTSPSATHSRITREIATVTPYALPQAWAAAFQSGGFGGVRYLGRFSTGTGRADQCVALFGVNPAPGTLLEDPAPSPAIDVALTAGIRVAPVAQPAAVSALTIITPPLTGPGSSPQ